ncbi:MAG: hypothetical protein H6706_27925 [Myxococcales bacterium]|nr:hypothetical protein [Myxococcales bacterium]
MKWMIALGLLAASAAHAEDAADWALPDAEASVVFRGAGRLAATLKALDARFGQTRAMRGLVPRILAFEAGGVRPFAADLGPGLDLGAGVAAFGTKAPVERFRFVFGVTDAEQAKASLVKLAGALGDAPLAATPTGFQAGEKSIPCAARGRFLVCDTQAVPEKAPGRPATLSPDALLDVRLAGSAAAEVGQGALETLSIQWVAEASGGRLRVKATGPEAVAGALKAWLPGTTPVGGADCLDARAGGVLKLSLDAPRLLREAAGLGVPVEVTTARQAVVVGSTWTGDLVLWLAGGFLHPVVALGLQPGADGEALVRLFAEGIQAAGATATVADGTLSIGVPDPTEDGAATTIRLRYGVVGQTLVLAVAERDVERCKLGQQRPLTLPAPLAGKGQSGFVLRSFGFGPGAPAGFVSGSTKWQVVGDLLQVATVQAMLLSELGFVFAPAPDGVVAELWWEVL